MSILIIGSGPNGLVAAYALARAGRRVTVLERRAEVGGGAITGELHPGFRCPTLSHEVLLHARIAREMDLSRRGVEWLRPDVELCAPALDGPPLVLYRDVARSVERLSSLSPADASVYTAFRTSLQRAAGVIASIFTAPPPDIDHPGVADLLGVLRAAARFRAMGRRDGYRLLRWGPMAVEDFVREWFSHELLCAATAAPALSGTMLGARSAGSTLVLLMREAHRQLAGGSRLQVRGGPGALTRALAAAASEAGAEIRTNTRVERILVRDERVAGVVAGGLELPADAIVSAVDPRTTFLDLIDPPELAPELRGRIERYRAVGTLAKVNLALASRPVFRGVPQDEALAGRIHIGPTLEYLERAFDAAKYGELSSEPWLDVSIPSIADPQLAPPGGHVASIYVHSAPYRLRAGSWHELKTTLLDRVIRTLDTYAPGIAESIVAAQAITPSDIEHEYGFAGGHIFHGELALDQLFAMRPLLGHARYRTPIRGLYLCGAGTHPGGFLTGASGWLAAREVLKDGRARGSQPTRM